jgi:lipoyl(octanoyl) transferase
MKTEYWGLIPYREAWERQKELFRRLIDGDVEAETIAVCEHPAVYTLGFHGNADNLLVKPREGVEVIRIERGGDITYHGPGQLVVYPLVDLRHHHLGVKQYVGILERAVRDTLEAYGIATTSNDDQIGVWLDWGRTTARKICAIGVKISHGATMHGLALNVNTDLSAFGLINPCGITDKAVTSMQRELGREVEPGAVAKLLTERLRDLID